MSTNIQSLTPPGSPPAGQPQAPQNPFGGSPDQGQPQDQQPNPQGFGNFMDNINFLRTVKQGKHVPLWVHHSLAHNLVARHGPTGHVIPHPNIDINDLSK